MFHHNNRFADLAAQIRAGDWQARAEFHEELVRALVHIVRQTLRQSVPTTSIARRILAEARRLAPDEDLPWIQEQDDFVDNVAEAVCDEVMAQMARRYGFAAAESVGSARDGATLAMR